MRTLPLLILLTACTGKSVSLDDTGGDDDTGGIVTGSFTVSPGSLDLGVVFLGETASATVEVTNTSITDLSLQLSVAGVYGTAYGVNVDDPTPAPGATATVTVLLAPTNWGDHAATLTVKDAGGDEALVAIAALVQEDADGDRHGSVNTGGDDCDDTDATVYPGAEETWYDGVDSDCAGDDDQDQDADGYPVDVDCDDTDDTVYPGHPDEWYDGVDADCAGNDDYDQDGDGFGLEFDCDDTDAAVYPGAPDAWYDDVDSDCAGNDDQDQDGDGFRVDVDCLDTDPSVYPGAPETWYDGVDSDCAGDDDYDQDGDGVQVDTDCNDTDPTTTGPEPEVWDGIDNDCSGQADDFGVADVAGAAWTGDAGDEAGSDGSLAMGGDPDGDGVEDVLIASDERGSYGMAWYVSGGRSATSGALDDLAGATFTGAYDSGTSADYFPVVHVAGRMADATGDGRDDLAVGGHYSRYGSTYGAYGLFDGTDATGALDVDDDAVALFYGDSTSADYVKAAALGDIDGDGTADLALGAAYDNYTGGSDDTSYSGNVSVFLGGSFSGNYDLGDADDQTNGDDDYDYFGWRVVVAEVTGDGYADVLATAPGVNGSSANNVGAVYVLAGSASGTWTGDLVGDAATVAIVGTVGDDDLGSEPLPLPADYDGDGQPDLAFADEDYGSAWIFLHGTLSGELDLGDASVTLTGSGGFGSSVAGTDFDGDGRAELVVGARLDDAAAADAGALWFFGGAWASAMTTADASALVRGTAAGDYLGASLAGGADLDGDGREDLLAGAPGADANGTSSGTVYVLPGR